MANSVLRSHTRAPDHIEMPVYDESIFYPEIRCRKLGITDEGMECILEFFRWHIEQRNRRRGGSAGRAQDATNRKTKSSLENKIKRPGRTQPFCFGARGHRVGELLSWSVEHPIEWREPKVDLAELAKLRWIEKWTRSDLAKRYGRTETAIQNLFQEIKKKDFKVPGLSDSDRRLIISGKGASA